MDKKVETVHYIDDYGNPNRFSILLSEIESISYHEPAGHGDRHYVDIKYSKGRLSSTRLFEFSRIDFAKEG